MAIKIIEINGIDGGSTGKIMLNIAKVASQKGMDVHTFSSLRAARGTDYSKHLYIDKKRDYYLHMILGMMSGFEMSFSYFATKSFIEKCKKISPDIIHLHNTHGWYINHKLLFEYINKNNIKVIWTLHDCWSFTGRCPHFLIEKCDKWISGCHDCAYDKKKYPASYFFDRSRTQWILKKELFTSVENMTLVTPSKWLSDLAKQSYLKDYPIKVINNGIDLNIFKPTQSDFREKYNLENKKVLLGVSFDWGKRKGLDVFSELSKRLGNDYKIVLVGTDDRVDAQLPTNIISIHRTQNQKELAEIYTAADLFVNPTREEVFGMVNIESLACGTPVVTFNSGGSPETIDETSGKVVACDDIDAMENEIIRICTQKPYSAEVCVERAKQFDMNDRFQEYVRLYQEIYDKK